MTTDFNKNVITTGGSFRPSTIDTPSDIRTRINTIAEMELIPLPYVGMMVYVVDEDEYYKVKSLKAKAMGPIDVENAVVDEYERIHQGMASEEYVQDVIKNIQVGDEVDLSEYAKTTYVDEQIANIEHPQYDDSEIKERLDALEEINHDEFLKEHQDISHLAVKEDVDAMFAAQQRYVIGNVPEGTLVDYREKEIRVMCPEGTEFPKQQVGPGGNSNMYYMSLTSKAPEGAVKLIESDGNKTETIDLAGKNSKVIWLALANNGSYFGKTSSLDKYIGWTYTLKWLDENDKVIESDCFRINLSNEECHNAMQPYHGFRVAGKTDLEGFATQLFVQEEIAKAQLEESEVDLSAYATVAFVNQELANIELKEGPQGPQGPAGEKGEDGVDGKDFTFDMFTEEQLESLRGPQGIQGEAGKDGEQGPQGLQGEMGPQGERGEKGEQGEVGPQGEQGPAGENGKDGIDGKDFTYDMFTEEQLKALIGPQGPEGIQGPVGPQGEQGIQGPQGEIGPQGPEGLKGEAFKYEDFTLEQLEALRGPQGEKGEQGPAGPQGEIGPQGPQGPQGDTGERGERGERGEKGEEGPAGRDGIQGEQGPVGPMGPQGNPGPQGEQGPQGEKGEDGEQGEQGIGVQSVSIEDNHLMVTLTDGQVLDAGEMPAGSGGGEGGGADAEEVAALKAEVEGLRQIKQDFLDMTYGVEYEWIYFWEQTNAATDTLGFNQQTAPGFYEDWLPVLETGDDALIEEFIVRMYAEDIYRMYVLRIAGEHKLYNKYEFLPLEGHETQPEVSAYMKQWEPVRSLKTWNWGGEEDGSFSLGAKPTSAMVVAFMKIKPEYKDIY